MALCWHRGSVILAAVNEDSLLHLYRHWASAMGNQCAAAMEDALREDIEVEDEGSDHDCPLEAYDNSLKKH
jgi:hypothetical protein